MNKLYKPFQPLLTETGLDRFGLGLEHSPACKILRGIVHSYLQISAAKPTLYPVMPDGTQAVFISSHATIIGGAQSSACDIQILQPGEYFGIRFYPGALRHFFDLNLYEITDQFVDRKFFPSSDFAELHNRIFRVQGFQKRAQICEQLLLRHFNPRSTTQFEQAMSLIYQSFGNIKVSQLADMVGFSSRHLNRLFRFHTGLSTKTFVQTIRIQHVCRQLFLTPSNSLQTAHELGFFDQSHLINDYKKRLLSNPAEFFNRFIG